MRDILFGGTGGGSWLADVGLTLLRVTSGVLMAVLHGADKIRHPSRAVGLAESMDFPMPTFFGWMAAISEFFGGVLLALGLATRPAGFLLACTMFTAAFIRHAGEGWKARELALLYLFIAVLFMMTGSGRYGADALIQRKRSPSHE
jgi:putative oxidoreductase